MKKHSINTYFIILFLLAACTNTPQVKPPTTASTYQHSTTEATVPEEPQIKNEMLQAIYQQYALLTEALIKDNVNEAKISANALQAGAQNLNGGGPVANAATQITTAKNIDGQRAAYARLSTALKGLIKKEGMRSGELYIASCPMALNDKGASWITNKKEIRNPYFGEQMLSCGDIEETLK